MPKLKIGIIGLGMVGDTIRQWFQEIKHYKRGTDLFCYDTDAQKSYRDDLTQADIIFVAVPTPPKTDGSCDTSMIKSAIAKIPNGKIIVIKSTVEPGTIENLQKKYPKKFFLFNPEFLTESQAWSDFIDPDRQIIGYTQESKFIAGDILALLPDAFFISPGTKDKNCYGKTRINATESEIGKYAANVFGYIKVIFGNMLADMARGLELKFKQVGINSTVDYENIKEMIGHDPRIGMSWLNINHGSYCGAGGYCFPKDMNALIHFNKKLIKEIKKIKNIDKNLIKSLEHGFNVLIAIKNYNTQLLKWQGLSVKQVSDHVCKLILKPKKIRG